MLIISKRFYPGNKSGGPQTSLLTFCKNAKRLGYENIRVLTFDRDVGDEQEYFILKNAKNNVVDYDFAKVIYVGEKSKLRLILSLLNEYVKAKSIIINSFFDPIFGAVFPVLISFLTKKDIYCFVRGELQGNSLSIKPKKKKLFNMFLGKIISNRIVFIFSNKHEYEDTLNSIKFKIKNYKFVPNLPQLPNKVNECSPSSIKSLKIIYLGRIDLDKNLSFLIKVLTKQERKISLDIYGPIRNKFYWSKCEKQIADLPRNIKVTYCGILKRKGLEEICFNYHFLVCPSFSENYGHSIAESLACGLPVIVSKGTPWKNLSKYDLGYTLELDIDEWIEVINQIELSDYSFKYDRKKTAFNFLNFPMVASANKLNENLINEIWKK